MPSRLSRRQLLGAGAGALAAAASHSAGCASGDPEPPYEAIVARTWRHAEQPDGPRAALRELARLGTLAANSHNTQPWRFLLARDRITILPDFTRRTPIVDPDDHHLFVSLGCAAENIVQAAPAFGFAAEAAFDPSHDAIRIELVPTTEARTRLFEAIPVRRSTRSDYDGSKLAPGTLDALEASAIDDSQAILLYTDRSQIDEILEFVVAANTAQIENDAFVDELASWLRFNERAAVKHRDGLFSASSGNPTMPTFLGRLVFDFVFTAESENDRYRKQMRSSSGVAAFVAAGQSKSDWVAVGRSFERFALQATVLGLKHAHINQPVEVASVRKEIASYLGIGDARPDLLVRFGRGPELPRSLRRPVDHVIVED